ncbi:serine hydrolase [Streptomyces sp. NPDC059650]|uniref:serine hydrolase n=1 Tax=Streptomyces sp. NPDC059650 TaxID=3346896 RepID=UPI0036B3732E
MSASTARTSGRNSAHIRRWNCCAAAPDRRAGSCRRRTAGTIPPILTRSGQVPAQPRLPQGAGAANPEPYGVTEFNPSLFTSAGDLSSSADDLGRFYRALRGGRLLPPAQLAEMRTTADAGGGPGYGPGSMPPPGPADTSREGAT